GPRHRRESALSTLSRMPHRTSWCRRGAPPRLHADRVVGGDSDHRHPHRPAPARRPEGPRGRCSHQGGTAATPAATGTEAFPPETACALTTQTVAIVPTTMDRFLVQTRGSTSPFRTSTTTRLPTSLLVLPPVRGELEVVAAGFRVRHDFHRQVRPIW